MNAERIEWSDRLVQRILTVADLNGWLPAELDEERIDYAGGYEIAQELVESHPYLLQV